MTQKIVINSGYDILKLSPEAVSMYYELKPESGPYEGSTPRDDPCLLEVVKIMGKKVNTKQSKLKIVEIPDNINWNIEIHCGKELIVEEPRTWE